ncbi:metallopeptidase family protein [Demequina lutea]|uniref:Putative Zn-dependent protease with MMP-like domain n=1 Tax=Demequina lutea TaxID=431489 RepID=A0A7Z0CID4_9MICO|nr:metallopeptidase family protein [Demequina lutea]NYI41804.1 putative Zn-dependent protease with MMP-like domain [Demequina lutea]
MSPVPMSHEEFEDLVRDAMDSLPDWTAPILQELAVLVEDAPAPGTTQPGTTLLGLYRGIPATAHGGRVAGSMPDTISLYRLPILSVCTRREDVPARVLKVLGHEVGHAMGISEAELRELGWF